MTSQASTCSELDDLMSGLGISAREEPPPKSRDLGVGLQP